MSDLALPRLPRRGLIGLLGGMTLAGALGQTVKGQDLAADQSQGVAADKKKCKDKGQNCDKKKCNKDGKKCCCKDLKCKNDKCTGSGGSCSTDANFDFDWDSFDTNSGSSDFNNPFGITTDPDGNVFVTDTDHFRVLAFNKNGSKLLDRFGSQGNGDDEFQEPSGIGFNENSSGKLRLIVADPIIGNNRRIRIFEGDVDSSSFGDTKDDLGDETNDNNIFPVGVAVDSKNRIWVTDAESTGKVFLFDKDGDFTVGFTPSFTPDTGGDNHLDGPQGIAVFRDDNDNVFVYVADTMNNRIVKFEYVSNNSNSGLEHKADIGRNNGQSGTGNKEFNRPTGLAVDACGNLWVADRFNDRIQVFDKNLDFIDNFTHGFNEPTGVALNPDGDELYVVDSSNDRIVAFSLD